MIKFNLLLTAVALASSVSVAMAWDALPTEAPAPSDNPTTPAKVDLGKMLYHDPRLSSTGTVSCSSCHNTMLGGEDNRPNSMGVNGQTGGRSAPTVWNAAFNKVQFWDGRAESLEAQAAGPVTNPIEMGMKSWDDVVARLNTIEGYKTAFAAAFGGNAISKDTATKAIAAYERTLITPNSPYDKYTTGEKAAMTEDRQRACDDSRALLKNPPILLLDEATSALDSVAELAVQQALDRLMTGRTTFVVAHRLSTLRSATRILVLQNGRMVGFAGHSELLLSCEVYRQMWTLQQIGGAESGSGSANKAGSLGSGIDFTGPDPSEDGSVT